LVDYRFYFKDTSSKFWSVFSKPRRPYVETTYSTYESINIFDSNIILSSNEEKHKQDT